MTALLSITGMYKCSPLTYVPTNHFILIAVAILFFHINNSADTTDIQRVEAIFFENWLYSYCSFANNSLASGCLIKLLLRGRNETEDFEISRAVGNSCNMTNNRFEAYSGLTVTDIEASGMEGNFSLNVSAREVSRDEFMNISGCDLGDC